MDENKIGLGTVQFGLDYGISNRQGKVPRETAKEIIELCKTNQIDLFDTAPGYACSEKVLGELIRDYNTAKIVTKVPPLKFDQDSKPPTETIRESIISSLANLNRAEVYGLLTHGPEDWSVENTPILEEIFVDLKEKKTIQKSGGSFYCYSQYEQAVSTEALNLVQVPINILDQRLLYNDRLLSLKEQNVEIHSRSTFLQGVFFLSPEMRPPWLESVSDKLDKIEKASQDLSLTIMEFCLNFVLNIAQVDKVIVGVTNAHELKQIVNAKRVNFDPKEFSFLSCNDENIINPSRWKV